MTVLSEYQYPGTDGVFFGKHNKGDKSYKFKLIFTNLDNMKQALPGKARKDNHLVAQVTEDLSTRKILQTWATIETFTGKPPKDATHIEDLKHVIETFPHPNISSDASHQDTGGTLPVDSTVWTKLTDWKDLTQDQQNETKEFLLTRFSVDDLLLAWDQYYIQRGEIPNSIQYKIFINNWRGNKTTRRTQSLAELMRTIETKDEEIHRRTDENQIVHSEMDLVTHIYNGQLRHLQDEVHKNEILRGNIHHLEQEVEQKNQDNDNLREINGEQSRQVYQLRRSIVQKDRQICEKYSRNMDLEDTKQEYECVIKRQKLVITEKKDQLKDNSATITGLVAENKEQSATITGLVAENKEQSATITGLVAENKEQSAAITGLVAENKEQSATITGLVTENKEQSATIDDLVEQNHDRSETISELTKQTGNQAIAIEDLNNKVSMEIQVNKTKEQIIAEQSQVIEEMKERISMYETRDRELRREKAEQDKINKDLYDQLEDVKKLCNKLMMNQAQWA